MLDLLVSPPKNTLATRLALGKSLSKLIKLECGTFGQLIVLAREIRSFNVDLNSGDLLPLLVELVAEDDSCRCECADYDLKDVTIHRRGGINPCSSYNCIGMTSFFGPTAFVRRTVYGNPTIWPCLSTILFVLQPTAFLSTSLPSQQPKAVAKQGRLAQARIEVRVLFARELIPGRTQQILQILQRSETDNGSLLHLHQNKVY